MTMGNPVQPSDSAVAKAVACALGAEIQTARDALGLSRAKFVRLLPSGIGDRTLLAYEHGLRWLTVIRLLELCDALGTSAPELLARALRRAALFLDNLTIEVDLRKVLNNTNVKYRSLEQWARNRLNDAPDGVAAVTPSAIRELAAFLGQPQDDLARYLSTFMPEPLPEQEDA
jgi:transcriptional regulator with XRE-family HTH domain